MELPKGRVKVLRVPSWLFTTIVIFIACEMLVGQNGGQQTSDFARIHVTFLPHNGRSCAECHSVPRIGGSSRTTVLRSTQQILRGESDVAGLLHASEGVRRLSEKQTGEPRVTLDLLGDGYVEAIPNDEIVKVAESQRRHTHGVIHGEYTLVNTLEGQKGVRAVGRFGWKAQHASLLSACAEPLYSELGIANMFFMPDPPSSPQALSAENNKLERTQIDLIVQFVRSTEPIAPDSERSVTESAQMGSRLFDQIGCSTCHVETFRTAPPGSRVDGVLVSDRTGHKDIHPYSDFLLHDIGTGDDIVQNVLPEDYDASTAEKFRTAPLWGVRFRSWMMHDGKSVTYHQAIMRHAGEAEDVVRKYRNLTPVQKEQLWQFLDSL